MTQPILQPPGDFSPQTVVKVERLLELLGEINDHRYLGPRLVLHGGTALNVFHLDIPRLSVDIDLLYFGSVLRETMLSERSEVRRELEELVRKLGYTHNAPRDEHAGVTYKLTYRATWGEDTIKVDLSFLNPSPVLGYEVISCRHCAPQITFKTVPYVELVAGKVKALMERRSAAARDLYDVCLASRANLEDRELLQAVTVYYWTLAEPFPRPLDGRITDRFVRMEQAFESDLFPVLLADERPDLAEMIDEVSLFLDRIGALSPTQREYAELLAKSGTFRPELIFSPWPEVLQRAQVSPAAAWKVQNLRKRPNQT